MDFCEKKHRKICFEDEVGCPLCHALDVADDLLDRIERLEASLRGQDRKVTDLSRMLEKFEEQR